MTDAPTLKPDPRSALSDLVEAVLNKGVILHLDLLITVAGVPLIGISLRAAIAGIETMLEHGLLTGWDAQTRASVASAIAGRPTLDPGESVVLRMAGAYEQHFPDPVSRPGTVYLTTHRLLVQRREPCELLWSALLSAVKTVWVAQVPVIGGFAPRIHVAMQDGTVERLAAARPEQLAEFLSRHGA